MKLSKRNGSEGLAGSKGDNNISYQTLASSCTTNGVVIAPTFRVPRKTSGNDINAPVVPVTNLPDTSDNYCDTGKGMPSKRDFTVYRLKRQLQTLKENEAVLLAKLTYAQETLLSQKRFIEVGLQHGQWETLGQMTQRKAKITACIEAISDPNSNPQRIVLPKEEQERLKKQL